MRISMILTVTFFSCACWLSLSISALADVYSFDAIEPRQQVFARYFVTSLMPQPAAERWVLSNKKLEVDCVQLPQSCSWLDDIAQAGQLDFNLARDTWQQRYLEHRVTRGHGELVPTTVETLLSRTDYRSWPREVVEFSRVKRARRVIFRGQFQGLRLSIAETHVGEGSEQVRETEVLAERLGEPDSFEFYAYDEQGRLAPESEFPAGVRPAPMICVMCHMNRETGKPTRFIKQQFHW